MSELIDKEVYFGEYCPKCKYRRVIETEDPCNECLTNTVNFNSHKPVKFEKGGERSNGRNKNARQRSKA